MASPGSAKGSVPLEILQVAERGAKLFPLAPHSKKPLVDHWQLDNNTSDPKELQEIADQFLGCNWAMVTGPASHLFGVDYDCKGGKSGLDWYQQKLEQYGPEWADTRRVRTPTGGLHDHFLWPANIPIGNDNNGKLAPGVDIKGIGGYLVVPPSEIDGKRYYFEDCDGEKEILPAPFWMLGELDRVFGIAHEEVRPALKEPVEGRKFHEFERHNVLKTAAGRLCNARIGYDGLLAHFRQLNKEWFEPPYPDKELIRQARSMHDLWAVRGRPQEVIFGRNQRTQKVNGQFFEQDTAQCILVPFSEIPAEPVEFLWDPYIPIGMLTMLTGDPGVGKSFIALSIAAEVTKNGGVVFYMTLENHPRKVLRPRFDALGGDPTKIFWMKAIQYGEEQDKLTRTVTLQDIRTIEKAINGYGATLVVVDPLQSFLGSNIDAYRFNETRPVLDGLSEVAERHEVTVLIVRHGTKATTGRIIHRGLGSIDFTGAVRSELYAGETADQKEKAMVHTKPSVGPRGVTRGYKITDQDDSGTLYRTGYFCWTGPSDLKAEDLTRPEQSKEDLSALEEAERFLTDYLGDGPKWQKEVLKKSKMEGIKEITLRRAKEQLKVGWEKRDGVYWWNLPSLYK